MAKRPTVMEIIEFHSSLEEEWQAKNDGEDLPVLDFARAVLERWGNTCPYVVSSDEGTMYCSLAEKYGQA